MVVWQVLRQIHAVAEQFEDFDLVDDGLLEQAKKSKLRKKKRI
jgi:hypothetical protein